MKAAARSGLPGSLTLGPLHHVGLVVDSVDAMLDFYRAGGAWECTHDIVCGPAASEAIGRVLGYRAGAVERVRMAMVRSPVPASSGQVEYLEVGVRGDTAEHEDGPAPATTVLSHAVRDIVEAWPALIATGAEVVCEPTTVALGDVRAVIASVRHGSRSVVELVQFTT